MPITTPVEFQFYHPDGKPLVGGEFTVTLRRSGFLKELDGVVVPDQITSITDADGKAIVQLHPTSMPYFVQLPKDAKLDADDCSGALVRYKMYVPVSETIVRAQDLFIEVPPSTTAYDEEALLIIVESKVAAIAAAKAAGEYADRAEVAAESTAADADAAHKDAEIAKEAAVLAAHAAELAQTAIDSAEEAGEAAKQAKLSQEAAALSEQRSGAHAEHAQASQEVATSASTLASEQAGIAVSATQAATASAGRADASEKAAKASELASKASEEATSRDAAIAADAKQSVETNAGIASAAATAADNSATAAAASEQASTQAAASTAEDRTVVVAAQLKVEQDAAQVALDKANVAQNTAEAKTARDQAVDAAASIAGALVEMGGIDLSSNTYPPKPAVAGIWKVTAGGIVGDVDYGIGDSLVYSKTLDQFYKIDNTEAVSSVNGKTGVVVLGKADVGLALADNTPDAAKPVSDAQRIAIDAKQDLIPAGTEAQYLNGLKQWSSLFVGVRAATLTGFVVNNADAVTSVDTVLVALGKLQAQLTAQAASISNRALKGVNSDITELKGLNVPLSVGQGGWGGNVGVILESADATNNGHYTVTGTWTGSVFPGADSRNQGYLHHDNWHNPAYALQVFTGVDPSIGVYRRWKLNGVWQAWDSIKSGGDGAGMAVGMIYPWGLSRATIPAGGIPRDGQLLDRATWPDLWNLIKAFAIDDSTWLTQPTTRGCFSTGNGTTTFRMPDTNAKHPDGLTISAVTLRGDGKNSAGTAGLHQADQFQGSTPGRNNFKLNIYDGSYASAGTAGTARNSAFFLSGVATPPDYYVTQVSDGVNGTPRVGTETRMSNETVIWCTHGAAKEVNTGSVDVTALATNVVAVTAEVEKLKKRKVQQVLPTGHGALFFLVGGSVYGIMGAPTTYVTTGAARGFQAGTVNAGSWKYGLPGCMKVAIPDSSPVVKIGGNGICNFALCANGNLYAWGNQSGGQFGVGNANAVPTAILSNTGVLDAYSHSTNSALSSGESRFFVRKADGVYAAGNNQYGACGAGSTINVQNWSLVFPLATGVVKDLWNLGALYGCTFLRTTDNRLFACGYNAQGQLGTGDTANKVNFVDVTANWGGAAEVAKITEMTGGYGFQSTSANPNGCTIAIAANWFVRTCGANDYGQLGVAGGARSTPYNVPLPSLPKDAIYVGDGPGNVFVIGQDNKVYVWGHNGQGQDGTGVAGNKTTPTALAAFSTGGVDKFLTRGFSRNTWAYGHTTFIKMLPVNGIVEVWAVGKSGMGQAGTGILTEITTPRRVVLPGLDVDGSMLELEQLGQLNTEAAETGGATMVAISAKGFVYAWGSNGQKGLFETTSAGVYESVPMLSDMPWNN